MISGKLCIYQDKSNHMERTVGVSPTLARLAELEEEDMPRRSR